MSQNYNFFFDIDGTLIQDGTQLTPSAAVTEAMRYAKSKGCHIFLNTGRTKITLPSGLTELDCIEGFLCGCGTYIEYGGRPILENYICTDDAIEIARLYEELGVTDCLYFEGPTNVLYCGSKYVPFADIKYIQIPSAAVAKEMLVGQKINKLSLHFLGEFTKKEFLDMLPNKYQLIKCPTYYEIVPLGFDKGRAIELTEQLLGLDHSLSVSVGDSENDVKMFDYTQISVAMGNARDCIKKRCTAVTDTVQNDGVAKMIYNMLKY